MALNQDRWHSVQEMDGGNDDMARHSRAERLQASRLRVALFEGLQVDSPVERQAALEKIVQVVKSYMRVAKSPFSPIKSSVSTADSAVPLTPSTGRPSTETCNGGLVQIPDDTTTHTPEVDSAEDEDDVEDNDEQLQYFLLTILRLSFTCPFRDVRRAFSSFLQITTDTTIPVPQPQHISPSYFIPLKDIFSFESAQSGRIVVYPRPSSLSFSPWDVDSAHELEDSLDMCTAYPFHDSDNATDVATESSSTGGRPSDEFVCQVMLKTYMEEGRLPNLFRVLAFFPTFYEIYHRTYTNVLEAPAGSLPNTWKYYVAIMTSAEQQCQYLVSMLKLEFLQQGGDPTWLWGVAHCPAKLRHLSKFVLKMSRQPWRIKHEDILDLTNNERGPAGSAWSKRELVQVVVIIATFSGLSSFVLGCGLAPELDMKGGYIVRGVNEDLLQGIESELEEPLPADAHDPKAKVTDTGWYERVHRHQQQAEECFTSDGGYGLNVTLHQEEEDPELVEASKRTDEIISMLKTAREPSSSKEELRDEFEKLCIGSSASGSEKRKHGLTIHTHLSADSLVDSDCTHANAITERIDRFALNPIPLEDFDPRHDAYDEFMLSDYCWEDQGCNIVNYYLPGIGDDLDSEFNEARCITDWTLSHVQVGDVIDTSPLRNAIWQYVQQLFGISKEDYHCHDVDTYLTSCTKEYIYKVCRQPSSVRYTDWTHMGIAFRPEEKCHVNLLIASAKKQSLLCYGLYWVTT